MDYVYVRFWTIITAAQVLCSIIITSRSPGATSSELAANFPCHFDMTDFGDQMDVEFKWKRGKEIEKNKYQSSSQALEVAVRY